MLTKEKVSRCFVMTDVAMDPYSSDGHDGIYKDGKILNDETLEVLGVAVSHRQKQESRLCCASDMMDGRVDI
jgi:porphobilinogen synthase